MSLEGRTVATTLVLTYIPMKVCGSLKDQSTDPQGELCVDHPMKAAPTVWA